MERILFFYIKGYKVVNKMVQIIILELLCLSLVTACEAHDGIGQMAENLMEPLGLVLHLIYVACFMAGGGFIFASIIKYMEHRQSPLMVPISLVVTLFFSGMILIFLPFLSYLTGNGFLYVFTKLS
jgi:hypothetical protein